MALLNKGLPRSIPDVYRRLSALEENISAADWNTLINKPAVIAAGDDQAAARTAIGAGTSNLTLGTSATTAKAGNYAPTWGEVTGKPAVIAAGADQAAARTAIGAGTGNSNLAIGTTAATAMAGNKTPASTTVGGITQMPAEADLAGGADLAAVVTKVNTLLSKLRACGALSLS